MTYIILVCGPLKKLEKAAARKIICESVAISYLSSSDLECDQTEQTMSECDRATQTSFLRRTSGSNRDEALQSTRGTGDRMEATDERERLDSGEYWFCLAITIKHKSVQTGLYSQNSPLCAGRGHTHECVGLRSDSKHYGMLGWVELLSV